MTDVPAIDLVDVSWTYAGAETPALDALDLTIGHGETVILAGTSGSGKSTTLRLLNGLIPHLNEGELNGDIRLLGASAASLDLAEFGRSTGSVWQHPFRQFFTSTVTDEIAFAMENHAVPPARIRHRVRRAPHRPRPHPPGEPAAQHALQRSAATRRDARRHRAPPADPAARRAHREPLRRRSRPAGRFPGPAPTRRHDDRAR